MVCFDNPEDIYIYGNYDTSQASSIMVVWERCDPEKNALSEATKDIKCVDDATYQEWA